MELLVSVGLCTGGESVLPTASSDEELWSDPGGQTEQQQKVLKDEVIVCFI